MLSHIRLWGLGSASASFLSMPLTPLSLHISDRSCSMGWPGGLINISHHKDVVWGVYHPVMGQSCTTGPHRPLFVSGSSLVLVVSQKWLGVGGGPITHHTADTGAGKVNRDGSYKSSVFVPPRRKDPFWATEWNVPEQLNHWLIY